MFLSDSKGGSSSDMWATSVRRKEDGSTRSAVAGGAMAPPTSAKAGEDYMSIAGVASTAAPVSAEAGTSAAVGKGSS